MIILTISTKQYLQQIRNLQNKKPPTNHKEKKRGEGAAGAVGDGEIVLGFPFGTNKYDSTALSNYTDIFPRPPP